VVTFLLNGKTYQWFHRMPENEWREIRQYVYARDEGMCNYCFAQVRLDECHVHHTLELSRGGSNHPSNLKVLCIDCHKARHPFMRSARDKLYG
jgi:5-methylcytosine-specific restriction endonuclease McrA